MLAILMRSAVLVACVGAMPALADDGGFDPFDASLPDASVGQGGADQDNPEGSDGLIPTTCSLDRDCAAGFRCQAARCTYTGVQKGKGGCLGDSAPLLVPLALPFAARLLRRRRAR